MNRVLYPVSMAQHGPCRTVEQATRDAALADARYRYVRLRNDLPMFRSRAKQFEILNRMAALRRTMLRLKVGDQRFHEMSLAYRAKQRKAATADTASDGISE